MQMGVERRPEGGISVERLTIPDVILDRGVIQRSIIDAEKVKECAMELYWRLKAVEDAIADEESEEYDLNRLRELTEADRDGRCVVIPFKPPRWVYMCSERFPKPGEAYYASTINVLQDMEKGCVFGDTPEEAEAALKGDQHG